MSGGGCVYECRGCGCVSLFSIADGSKRLSSEATEHTCHQLNSLRVLQSLLTHERLPGLKVDGMPNSSTNSCRKPCVLVSPRRSQQVPDLLPIREVGGKHFTQDRLLFHVMRDMHGHLLGAMMKGINLADCLP